MPEEIESPVESVSEEMNHHAEHAGESWLKWCALAAACYAVLAAVAGLQSSHFANDAMLEQIEASDQWSYYQAKGIKAMVAESERHILKQLGKEPDQATPDPEKYKKEQEDIQKDAQEKVDSAKAHLMQHEILSRAVTMFQVSIAVIAVIAISVLTRRRHFALFSVAMSALGLFFLVQALWK
jgi:hypothetical protein